MKRELEFIGDLDNNTVVMEHIQFECCECGYKNYYAIKQRKSIYNSIDEKLFETIDKLRKENKILKDVYFLSEKTMHLKYLKDMGDI